MREVSGPEKGAPITLGRSRDPGGESSGVAAGNAAFSKALPVWQGPPGIPGRGEVGVVKFGSFGTGIKELFLIRDPAEPSRAGAL